MNQTDSSSLRLVIAFGNRGWAIEPQQASCLKKYSTVEQRMARHICAQPHADAELMLELYVYSIPGSWEENTPQRSGGVNTSHRVRLGYTLPMGSTYCSSVIHDQRPYLHPSHHQYEITAI